MEEFKPKRPVQRPVLERIVGKEDANLLRRLIKSANLKPAIVDGKYNGMELLKDSRGGLEYVPSCDTHWDFTQFSFGEEGKYEPPAYIGLETKNITYKKYDSQGNLIETKKAGGEFRELYGKLFEKIDKGVIILHGPVHTEVKTEYHCKTGEPVVDVKTVPQKQHMIDGEPAYFISAYFVRDEPDFFGRPVDLNLTVHVPKRVYEKLMKAKPHEMLQALIEAFPESARQAMRVANKHMKEYAFSEPIINRVEPSNIEVYLDGKKIKSGLQGKLGGCPLPLKQMFPEEFEKFMSENKEDKSLWGFFFKLCSDGILKPRFEGLTQLEHPLYDL